MPEATFRHGDPHMIDYTPSSGNIAAGQVVVYGNLTGLTCLICHTSILNNRKGAMAAGGGVYEVTNLNNAANGAKVYWDDTNNKVTTVSTNNAPFGSIASQGGAGANSACYALHKPYA
jgi:predicted RecA/RadA family phage recombinase